MASTTVYQGVAHDIQLEGVGQLFEGKSFWVAQRVPSRIRLLDDIKANGGEIVVLEKKADYLIADHFRKDCPPGTISYEFVLKSLERGELQDPEDHRCGPPLGEARAPGSITRPSKGLRAAYTADEDRILYKWVRDCEANGGLAAGNEIYKQLEAKHPRHTWQSWRDRYLKQLKNRPPSSFNLSDDAPPLPPSNQTTSTSTERKTSETSSAVEKRKEPAQSEKKVSGAGKARSKVEYTLEELEALFSPDDWEELYAFVETIDSVAGQDGYEGAWTSWAENQNKQTADQWRQYYEQVVRPQWLRDPEWKREQITKKVEEQHANAPASQSQNEQVEEEVPREESAMDQQTSEAEQDEPMGTEVNELNAEKPGKGKAKVSSKVTDPPSSTALPESPKILAEIYDKALKRVREDANPSGSPQQGESSRPIKRRKSASPTEVDDEKSHQVKAPRILDDRPIRNAQPEGPRTTSAMQLVQTLLQQVGGDEEDEDDNVQERTGSLTESGEDENASASEQRINRLIDNMRRADALVQLLDPGSDHISDSDADSNADSDADSDTSTPRPTRQKASNFDTQAILSSPILPPLSTAQSRLQDPENHPLSSSPPRHPESDASTTLSLQEFRRSLNGEEVEHQPLYPQLPPRPRARVSVSPAPSTYSTTSTSSTTSGDPDVPLDASELDDFFAEQNDIGFDDDFIFRALKRTRMRPGLAIQVLDAWKEGLPVPNQRGIWSIEDDENVESGDGLALARLERKHTLDGWGGITERMLFLEGWRK
ncbi:hypothetical protein IQ07DRAFT_642208 [Pyrenochaeta sp. DS3sAY3a]|nr:hypothetical protein IQ07DRAFT_642208 [Pyrenochaeta sp. DS3sAY3a]